MAKNPPGGPKGNRNRHNGYIWMRLYREAILRELNKRSDEQDVDYMQAAAAVLIDKAMEGDMSALIELGNRLDGKPASQVLNASELGKDHNDLSMRIAALRFVSAPVTADEADDQPPQITADGNDGATIN